MLPKKELELAVIGLLLFLILFLQIYDLQEIKQIATDKDSFITVKYPENITTISPIYFTESYITSDLYTVEVGAGLGNQMYEIASLYGIASHLKMKPFIQQKLLSQVTAFQKNFPRFEPIMFNNLTTQGVRFGSKCCSYENVEVLQNYANKNITMNGMYFQSHRFFDEIRPQLKELFAFSPSVLAAAQSVIGNIRDEFYSQKANHLTSLLLVCAHIRRGDYVTDPQLLESRKEFTVAAINWLRQNLTGKGSEAVFILLGNDRTWAESLFQNDTDIFIPPLPAEKTVDIALMVISCDVILLTASGSTFGFWGAYFSDKATVYYNPEYTKDKNSWYYNQFTPSDVFLSKWIPLKLNTSSILH